MRFLTLALGLMLITSPAFALSITNLSGAPQTVIIESSGVSDQIVIAPNQTWRTFARPYARLSQPGIRGTHQALSNYEYVIWPHGKLSIQSYGRRKHRNGGIF